MNYFHTPCQHCRSYTDEQIDRKTKGISEVPFEAKWKAREAEMRMQKMDEFP